MRIRKFPVILLIAAAVFFSAVGILSLSYLIFTVSFFLILISVFNRIKSLAIKKGGGGIFDNVWAHITNFYSEEKNIESEIPASSEDTKPVWAKLGVLYVILFFVIAIWRISRIFAIIPLSNVQFNYSIINAVLLLVFPCVAVIYLKLRKDEGSFSGDKTSRELLTLLAFISVVYAAIIALSLALNINILIVLRWVFYAAMVYLIAAFAGNILLSALKNNILNDFNYSLFPKYFNLDELGLNISLKSLYTVKYTLRIFPGLILALGFILLLSTSVFVVQSHQKAAVFRFGKLDRSSIVGEGIHFKLPWPIDKVKIYDVHRINSMQIGYVSPDNINFLWTQFHSGGEYLLLLGNGNEKVSVNMRISYTISDLFYYLKTSSAPEAVLSAAAYGALLDRTVNTTLDAFLSIDRSSLSASILEELLEFSAKENLGLFVSQVIIDSIHPPAEVADVYQRVISASIERNTIITDALTEAERRLIDAQKQSRTIVDYAQARQYNRVSAALQEMAVYYAAMEAHRINPGSFELTKYLDVFERVVEGAKVYVFLPGMENSIRRSVIGQSPGQAPNILEF
jgi:membrane protease subunit HflK